MSHHGRLFQLTGSEPYTRKDGTASGLLRWRSHCAACGAEFVIKTPIRLDGTKAFTRKHCDQHKGRRSHDA